MKRGEFTALFASVAAAVPIAARAVGRERLPHWIDRHQLMASGAPYSSSVIWAKSYRG